MSFDSDSSIRSQVPPSTIQTLLDRARKQNFSRYLVRASLTKVRTFRDQTVRFDFPVTAIIGPNGGGKTTALGAAAIAYKDIRPRQYFAKSGRFDDSMQNWSIEYELLDRTGDGPHTFRRTASFRQAKWNREAPNRPIKVFGVGRTVPANERPEMQRYISNRFTVSDDRVLPLDSAVCDAVGRILGKDVSEFTAISVTDDGRVSMLAGQTPKGDAFSEFHFGAGESSVIRMIAEIESMPDDSIILIEEIENGLHPVATIRMVEYLITKAESKRLQVIFTTHSDEALIPLPPEGIWAAVNGELRQGKLSILSLRAISGQIDARLVLFTEDEFASSWVRMMLRHHQPPLAMEALHVYEMQGDSVAVDTARHHNANPAVRYPACAIIDGDSQVEEVIEERVIRLPGVQPEAYVFNGVRARLDTCLARLSEALLFGIARQTQVERAITDVALSNADPHLLFRELGTRLDLLPERTVRDAFLSIWVQEYADEAGAFLGKIGALLPAVE